MNTRFVAGLALAALLAGCSPGPRAPALLQGGPVYVNAQEGFRFVPPPNWGMYTRAEVPRGPLSGEQPVVGYRRGGGSSLSSLDVSMEDVPEATGLAEVIKERRGNAAWKPLGPVETFELAGQPAARGAYQWSSLKEGGPRIKEYVAVRKGGRVYVFAGLFPANDAKSREQVRKSVETLSF